ncbi:MAG: beta-lactamase family protein [Alphaproteobacteria bacterium]|nr:beta-lactamase family protein [Alphaproteobacteria bacterium]
MIFRFFLFLLTFSIQASIASSLTPALQKLDQYILQQIQQKKVIGCTVAVVEGNNIIFMKAYGVKKKGQKDPIDLNTSFQLGSASKPIAATLIALLNKEGLINLDAPITPFYPHLKSRTTLRHVLTHTTGFKRKGWNNKIESGVLRSQLLKDIKTAEQDEPGFEFDYHNVVYSLMEGVVEGTQNQKMETLLQRKLLTPLGMNQTTIGYEDFVNQPNCAWPHQFTKKGALYPSKSYSRFYHAAVFTAAGINSNIQDMATFLKLQLVGVPGFLSVEDLKTFHEPKVEAKDALMSLRKKIRGNVQSYYGMGWRIADAPKKRIVYHGGFLKGFCNFVAFLPSRNLGIVILNNSEGGFASKTSLMFLNDWVE